MRDLPNTCRALVVVVSLLPLACQTSSDGAVNGAGGSSSAGGNTSLAGSAALPPETQVSSLLPARIRRLSNAEYRASAAALFGASAPLVGADFVPDSRQNGFTVNEAQRVDPVLASQLAEAAAALAKDLRLHTVERAPCADVQSGAEACARSFISSFGEQVFRRPLGADEVDRLLTVFRSALDGGSYDEGIELVTRAMLQAPSFLYLTEIGDAPAATIQLTPYELASSISFLIQGKPPSAELLGRALAGELDTPEGRALVVPGLFGIEARDRVVRVIREWLGTDRIADTAKDSIAYPDFVKVKAAMERETTEFLQVVVQDEGASLTRLLSADFTVANQPLAALYGRSAASADTFERIATPDRLGILHQGAFLSVFAHANETAPVLRGVALLRRLACIPIGDPTELSVAVVPPVPDLSKTTRERFSVHSRDPACAACHRFIDNFGFAFEAFDGMGAFREDDNGLDIDTSVVITGTDFDGNYADSNALVTALSKSPQVRECFARHTYRALSGTSAESALASEDEFVGYWQRGLSGDDVSIIDTLTAFVTNPAFAYRRGQ